MNIWRRKRRSHSTVTELVRGPMGMWLRKPEPGEGLLNCEAAALGLAPSFPDEEVSININGRAWHATWQPAIRVRETAA